VENQQNCDPLLAKPANFSALKKLLSTPGRPDAYKMLKRFSELLRLPNCATSYGYLTGDDEDDPEIVRRSEFEHVPDLGPEKAKRAAARSGQATKLEKLRGQGLLLFERSPAERAPCPGPAGTLLDFDLIANVAGAVPAGSGQAARFARYTAAATAVASGQLRRLAPPSPKTGAASRYRHRPGP
jgi:hypothetical protein